MKTHLIDSNSCRLVYLVDYWRRSVVLFDRDSRWRCLFSQQVVSAFAREKVCFHRQWICRKEKDTQEPVASYLFDEEENEMETVRKKQKKNSMCFSTFSTKVTPKAEIESIYASAPDMTQFDQEEKAKNDDKDQVICKNIFWVFF